MGAFLRRTHQSNKVRFSLRCAAVPSSQQAFNRRQVPDCQYLYANRGSPTSCIGVATSRLQVRWKLFLTASIIDNKAAGPPRAPAKTALPKVRRSDFSDVRSDSLVILLLGTALLLIEFCTIEREVFFPFQKYERSIDQSNFDFVELLCRFSKNH